jgi:arginine utilization protein RocB
MEYDPALKRNEILIHVTACVNTENIMQKKPGTKKQISYDSTCIKLTKST